MSLYQQSPHFYRIDGGSVYAEYDSDLRDAKKRKLYASPTTVSYAKASPYNLQVWKEVGLIEAALANPMANGESNYAYHKRIANIANERSSEAKEFGTALHDAIEHYPSMPVSGALLPWFEQYDIWHRENIAEVIASEIMLAHHGIGIAGKTDKIAILKRSGRVTVLDVKTQGVKEGKSATVYESWAPQLAFYAKAYQIQEGLPDMPDCANLVIDSNNPSPVIEKVWTQEEIRLAWNEFLCVAWIWAREKDHWPVGQWQPCEHWEF